MNHLRQTTSLLLAFLLGSALTAVAQTYIGFVYPAGGQRGSTFRMTMGGQGVEVAVVEDEFLLGHGGPL